VLSLGSVFNFFYSGFTVVNKFSATNLFAYLIDHKYTGNLEYKFSKFENLKNGSDMN